MIALHFTTQKVINQGKYDSAHVHVSGKNERCISLVMDAMLLFN